MFDLACDPEQWRSSFVVGQRALQQALGSQLAGNAHLQHGMQLRELQLFPGAIAGEGNRKQERKMYQAQNTIHG